MTRESNNAFPPDPVVTRKRHILLLEDLPDDAHLIFRALRDGGIDHIQKCVTNRTEFEAALVDFQPDLILSDHKLPDIGGEEALKLARQHSADVPFILVTGVLGEEVAVDAMKAGATDYILKDRLFRLVPAVRRALREADERSQRRQAEARYRSIYENAIEGIFQTTPDGRYLSANPALARILGFASPEELISTIADIGRQMCVEPESRAELVRQLETEGFVRDFENQIYRKDGSKIWVSVNARAVRNGQGGKILFYEGTSQDITARKEAESEATILAHAVESTAEMICITDLQDRFTFVNRAFEKTYGYSLAEILGKNPSSLFSPANPPELMVEILEKTRAGGWYGEVLDLRKDGTEFPVSLRTSPIKDAAGRVVGLVGVAQDITERKQVEKRNAAFGALSYKLSAAASAQAAGEVIMETASELFEWEAGYIHLYSQVEDKIVPVLTVDTVAGQRVPVDSATFTPDPSPLMRRVMNEGVQLINRSVADVPPGALVPFGDTRRPSACMMYVPIHSSREVIGILSVQSYTPGKYSHADVLLLQTLADRCGDALYRIKVTEALRETEAKYHSIFENATEGIFQTTPEGRHISANSALARIFGYASPAELIANISDLARQTYVLPERREELKRLLETDGLVTGFEAERFRKDGSRFWMVVNAHAVRSADGRLLYYEGTNQDITERKRAEAILRESEEKFRTLFQSAPIGMALHDAKGKYLQSNEAYRRMLGYTEDELRRLGVKRITHLDDVAEGQHLFRELVEGKREHYQREKRYIHEVGHTVWATSSASAVRNSSGELVYIISMVEDISERKQLEREVLEISANERRRVGHDLHDGLGQYLAGIAFKAKALEQNLTSEGVPHAAEARELATLVSNAISQTRSLARGFDPIEVETIGLPAALQNLCAETHKFFNLPCLFRCADSALLVNPQSALALYRIAQEAIHNAVTHGEARRLEVELQANPAHLSLRVQDDGVGFLVDSVKSGGMGLRVMHYRAQSIRGELQIKSLPGQGTEVRCFVARSACL